MQSVTMAENRSDPEREVIEGGATMGQAALPELWFVHPIPGFVGLRRFVLVRLEDEAGDAADLLPVGPPAADSGTAGSGTAGSGTAGSGTAGPAAVDPVGDGSAPSAETDGSPLYELRSLEQPGVRFMVAAPGAFFSDYDIELDDQEVGDLGLTSAEDALILVMLTVGRDAASTTANLLAPIVVNARTRAAAQVILTGSDWPVRAPLG